MKKKTPNSLFILLLALFTSGILITLLFSINVNQTLATFIGIISGLGLYSTYLYKQKNISKKTLKPVSDKRKQLYLEKGLSNEDINFFRETMNDAKYNILQIERNVNKVGKLRAITNRHDTVNLVKLLFKDIVNEPDRLHEVDQFLYVHLPSLTELTNKYVRINEHQTKNKETFEVLDQSAQTIDLVCQQIAQDYLHFRTKDIDDLATEVKLANKRLNREGTNIQDDEI